MLEPNQRRLLLESLRPPVGYVLDHAVGTTFSLDLVALLVTPLAFTFFDWEDQEGRPTTNPLALMEAVRRNVDKITIFCQTGQIKIPGNVQPLLGYLENSVIEVTASKTGGVFHPKVWVLRFVSHGGKVKYRFLCSSRNLTFDRSWDTVLVLDGNLATRKLAIGKMHPLGDFVSALPGLAVRSVSRSVKRKIAIIQEELRRTRFDPPPGFWDIEFIPIGLKHRRKSPFSPNRRPLLVMSPFLSDNLLEEMVDGRKGSVLISRFESMEEADPEVLKRFEKRYVLNPEAEPEYTDDGDSGSSTDYYLTGLHAKLYIIDDGWNATVLTGSANATNAAFSNNVEFLVKLRGKKGHCGIKHLLQEGTKGSPGFGALLTPYLPSDERALPDPEQKRLETMVEDVKRTFIEARFNARATRRWKDKEYTLSIVQARKISITLPTEVTVRCWPITLREGQAVTIKSSDTIRIDFGSVALESLTTFFAFEVQAKNRIWKASSRFVLNLELKGDPKERHDAILRSLLKSRRDVLRLLMLILASGDFRVHDLMEMWEFRQGHKKRGRLLAQFDDHLLESLLRTLDRDPYKLEEVHRLVTDLNRTDKMKELLPQDFERIWLPIWEAYRSTKK